MKEPNISNLLKQLRKLSGYSVKEAVEQLKLYDIHIAAKTLYGYECGTTMPNADTFIALCQIYKQDNSATAFDMPLITSEEIGILKKYRKLDADGRQAVDMILDYETDQSLELTLELRLSKKQI